MKLREINVQKFRAIENLCLSFEDAVGHIQPVTILAGPNGCGKTSVLFAIVQALRGIMGYRTDDVPVPSDFDIHRGGNGDFFSKTPPTLSVQLEVEFDPAEHAAIKQIFDATQELRPDDEKNLASWLGHAAEVEWKYPPSLRADGQRRPTWFVEKVTPWEAMHWFQGRLYAIRGWNKGLLPDPKLIDQVGGPILFPQDRSLRNRVTGVAGAAASAENEATVWEILREIGQMATSPQFEPAGTNGESLQKQAKEWEEQIQMHFHEICAPKEYLGFVYPPNDPGGAPYFKDQGSHYPLSMASSGEQVILEYITRLTYPRPMNRGLILIDEPEVHLHPGWVRQLYRALPKIGSDNQFIVTTHSVELRALAAADHVLIDLGDLQN